MALQCLWTRAALGTPTVDVRLQQGPVFARPGSRAWRSDDFVTRAALVVTLALLCSPCRCSESARAMG
eukprot:11335661-Alexandrium_andersonii.AAC.1